MQCINECFGGKTTCSPIPIHGKTSKVFHNKDGLFKGIPSPFIVARYHSLCVEPAKTTPLKIDATAEDGVIMALSIQIILCLVYNFILRVFFDTIWGTNGQKFSYHFRKIANPSFDKLRSRESIWNI